MFPWQQISVGNVHVSTSDRESYKGCVLREDGGNSPKKHDLISLAGAAGILDECTKEKRNLFRHLSLYYIETRYPDKRTALEAKCTQEYTKEMLNHTKEAVEWLKSKLK